MNKMSYLIEDEEKLSGRTKYLELNGYRVLRALNGLEGLSMFYDHMHEVDLILLDIMRLWMALRSSRRSQISPGDVVTTRDSIHDPTTNFTKQGG